MMVVTGLLGVVAAARSHVFTPVFSAGDANYSCFMNPSVISIGSTVLSFAEARWASCGDFDCRASKSATASGNHSSPPEVVCGRHNIALRRSLDGGATWTPLAMVVNVDTDFGTASSPNASVFNISPVWDSVRGKVVMLFNLQRAQYNTWTGLTNPKARETYVIVSTDSGVTWSSPRNITAQLQHEAPWAASRNPEAVTPGPGIQLKDGTLLVPGYGCPLPAAASCTTYSLTSTMRMWALRSVDGGDTWTMGKPAANVGVGEPMAIQRPDGVLVMNARPVQWPHDDKPHPDRHRLYALSSDGGVTWEPPGLETFTNLTGPSCEASFVRSDDLVLFANPANNIRRINMTFRVSKDWGATWQSTVVYGNSSWYSSIAVVPAPAREHASTSTALLFFSKDCDSPIAADPTTRETDHCKSISLWKTPL